MNTESQIIAYTYIGDFGQMVESIRFPTPLKDVQPQTIVMKNCFVDCCTTISSKGVLSVENSENDTLIRFDPFLYRTDFSVSVADMTIDKTTIEHVVVKDEELFGSFTDHDVVYRLYEPESSAPRPLILFLHGGGECGTDNLLQLTGTVGAISLAKRFPDMFVLAPQAPTYGLSMQDMFARMRTRGDPFKVCIGAETSIGLGDMGWNRSYLGQVCDLIRSMISEGRVDASRVYVIGMSMGGAGVITAVSIAPDLFASAVPICPSMNGDSYPLLENWPENVPAYLSSAYIDHQVGRHAYILRACTKLWEQGRTGVKYTLFTPEELEQYGIIALPTLTESEIRSANHYSWVLVLHNEYGILDWMISHRKKT